MSGTSKAIISICVLLLAALVVYYGMTPPEPSDAQLVDLPKQRPTLFGGNPEDKLIELGFPPIATELVVETESVLDSPDPVIPTVEPVGTMPVVVPIVEKVFLTYVVLEGDTLGEIASRELGSYRMWRELASINNISDPSTVMPGRVLRMPIMETPKETVEVAEVVVSNDVNSHQVEEGDTLSSIAALYYDDVNKYGVIESANPTVNPNRLKIGTRLFIPQL